MGWMVLLVALDGRRERSDVVDQLRSPLTSPDRVFGIPALAHFDAVGHAPMMMHSC